jgi:sarcosine oxidase, subunit alpha
MSGAGPYRLPAGGSIDRGRPIRFRFDNKGYEGFAGDTLASALLANGVRSVARSFKFHRPRGVFSCGIEEPNALLRIGSGSRAIPSARAPVVELTDGLSAFTQSGWPSPGFDVGRLLDLVPGLWAAGFYNKTFKWPRWHTYEGLIRRMAGLGRAPDERDPDRYEADNRHCDVLVVGGGIAGLTAAIEAGRAGSRVILAEQDSVLGGMAAWGGSGGSGGSTAWEASTQWGGPAAKASSLTARVDELSTALQRQPNVTILRKTTAVACYDHHIVTLVELGPQSTQIAVREKFWIVRAKRIVLATGALEQPLLFDNNDRPGILLAGAARQYLRRYGVAPGRKVVVATNNDSAYAAVKDLRDAGVDVTCVADSRKSVSESMRKAMRALNVAVMPGAIPIDTTGFTALSGVTLGQLSKDGQGISGAVDYPCDALLVSGGWNPALHLYAQAGGKLGFDAASGALKPVDAVAGIEIVGEANATGDSPIGSRASPVGKSHRQWVDLLHDVTVADLELALRENYTSVEHVKRYTTVGMSADQGKTSTVAAIDTLARLRGVNPAALGYTTQRPPFTPVTLGTIAGRDIGERFAPSRQLPLHDWHASQGALFQDFGEWKRPVAYVRQGEFREQAAAREARAVRTAAGIFDASPLGKFEIFGPDALAFVDRFYINNLLTLKAGRVRYGIMLRESGILFDDGTVTLLAPDHVLVSTTSGNAARVGAWMEEWRQCEWPELRVAIMPTTEQWATISVSGPKARLILSRLDPDIDLTPEAFPHLAMREGGVLGVSARVYRVSFTGELTYEINVPAEAGPRVWEALVRAGESEGIQPLGLDAMMQLRLEKGFLHIGTDTDGTTIPEDVGWGKVAAGKAASYIGKRSLALPEHLRSDRLQLVGLIGEGSSAFVAGSHLRLRNSDRATDGWVTSVGTLLSSGQPIALAMLRAGRQQVGSEVTVHDSGNTTRAEVSQTPFFDPAAEKMNA